MPRNDAAAPGHVCPGIRIHAIDIVQPPGIGISAIADPDIDAHQPIVPAALAANSSAETPQKARRSALVVLVMATPPKARLVASLGRAVEPLVHAPEAVEPTRVGGIGVVDDAVLEHERAHAGPLPPERRPVGADARRDRRADGPSARLRRRLLVLGREVVLPDARPLLLLGDAHPEVVVEVASERRRPREAPAHAPLVRLHLLE